MPARRERFASQVTVTCATSKPNFAWPASPTRAGALSQSATRIATRCASDTLFSASRAASSSFARKAAKEKSVSLAQRDTFFRVARGKLKLREEGGKGSLIHYGRIATS